MDKKQILTTIKKLRDSKYKKKFAQSVDLIINLKNLDLKKPENKIDFFMQLPHGKGKKTPVGIFVDDSLVLEAKKFFDEVIEKKNFQSYAKDKKKIKKLASKCGCFVSQANLMPEVAKNFGQILGRRGKMPNPKAGCIVPPKIILKPLYEKLQKMIRLNTKGELIIKCSIGTEIMKDEELVENGLAVYDNVLKNLIQGKNNFKSFLLKLTMSHPIKVGDDK
ncbi:MAG: 50S ribosomal protein L1 [Nanoarchaeota archaeon]|nr:50S ribosomal protein L1 [Nanoarchaeota archaeon]